MQLFCLIYLWKPWFLNSLINRKFKGTEFILNIFLTMFKSLKCHFWSIKKYYWPQTCTLFMTDNTSKGGQSFKPQNSNSDLSACQCRKGLTLFRVFSISLSFPSLLFLILSLSVSTLGNLCSHSLTLSRWNGWVSMVHR